MCGICGIYRRRDRTTVDPNILSLMNAAIRHRGPDQEGFFCSTEIGLGVQRLSIIDLATGRQPIWNEVRTCCIVFNGELYNYLDLRNVLITQGYAFSTSSDTEVILHAYEEWGPSCLKRFNGMFAIAIWNAQERTLFLARDRIGEKPLYYYKDQDRLVFASEIKAILQDRTIPRALNLRGLCNYLAFGHAVAPETIYEDIYKLMPGHYLIAVDGQIDIHQYWDVGDEPSSGVETKWNEAEFEAELLSLLRDSVRRRMVSDVPLGVFLSGGVDSSVIVSLMKQQAVGIVKTFSLGFTTGGAYNELADAKKVAQHFGTEHHELQVEHIDLVRTLQTLVYHYDEPFGDAACFPVYLLSMFAKDHVTVVLTGDGGDELFGGYRRYAADQLAPVYQRLPGILMKKFIPKVVNSLPRIRRVKRAVRTLSQADPARRYGMWLEVFPQEMRDELLSPELRANVVTYDPSWHSQKYYSAARVTDHLNRLMYVDVKSLLVDGYLEKTDKATMAASIEARLPLLDYRLVELAFQIPSQMKIRLWSTKRILKRAVAPLLPPEVLHRRKHGFAVPTDPWFRGELKEFAREVLFDRRTLQRDYFNRQYVEKLWSEHVEGRQVWDAQIWLLLNFELWHRIYLDGEAA